MVGDKGRRPNASLTCDFISGWEAVENGESIASEGKGEYMFVEGRVLSNDGAPVPDATIETWETDDHGTSFSPEKTGFGYDNAA